MKIGCDRHSSVCVVNGLTDYDVEIVIFKNDVTLNKYNLEHGIERRTFVDVERK